MPLTQLDGVQQDVPSTIAKMPAGTVGEYEDILARLAAVPVLVSQTIYCAARPHGGHHTTPDHAARRAVPGRRTWWWRICHQPLAGAFAHFPPPPHARLSMRVPIGVSFARPFAGDALFVRGSRVDVRARTMRVRDLPRGMAYTSRVDVRPTYRLPTRSCWPQLECPARFVRRRRVDSVQSAGPRRKCAKARSKGLVTGLPPPVLRLGRHVAQRDRGGVMPAVRPRCSQYDGLLTRTRHGAQPGEDVFVLTYRAGGHFRDRAGTSCWTPSSWVTASSRRKRLSASASGQMRRKRS